MAQDGIALRIPRRNLLFTHQVYLQSVKTGELH